jgi:hypothetical protein
MNYFERLVQRALARPVRGAEPLHDPFEEAGLLELERPPSDARTTPIAAQAAASAAPGVEVRDGTPLEPTPTMSPPPVRLAEVAPSVEASPTQVTLLESAKGDAVAPLPTPPPEFAARVDATPGDAQEIADGFMRALGVPMPDAARPREAAPQPEAAKRSAPPPPTSETAVPRAPSRLRPPPAPLPWIPRARAIAVAPPEAPDKRERKAAQDEAPASKAVVIERREVVLVAQREGAAEGPAVRAAGAPRFGLGQL